MEYNVATGSNASAGKTKLEEHIQKSIVSAARVIEQVHTVIPVDALAPGNKLTFQHDEIPGVPVVPTDFKRQSMLVQLGNGSSLTMHRHALEQVARRAEIPVAYVSDLIEGEPWQRDLLAEIFNRHYRIGFGPQRFLLRSVKQQLRGFLSDRYRRLDSRPLLEAFTEICQEMNAVPIAGEASDVRVAVKAILPIVFEPMSGEVIALGIEWSNSDFGAGTHSVRCYVLRLTCLNGATTEDLLKQVHVGGRLAEEIEWSQSTYELDTKTSVSALTDTVRHAFSPKNVNGMLLGIQRAHEKQIDWRGFARTPIAKRLLKSELDAAKAAFESEDVVNLPAGQSIWRASNALSWIAKTTQDIDRRLELQRLAGEVLDGAKEAA